MSLDHAHFTPLISLLGGALIGTAAVLMMVLFGRIAGVSGILGSTLTVRGDERPWRFAFLFGLVSSGIAFAPYVDRAMLQAAPRAGSVQAIVIAGLLVGFGTRLGSGCTSGHGICGIGRLSPRSIIATCVFVLFGMLTVYALGPAA